ncbi:MAG: hypothetical protein ACXVRZ_07545 [Gaiellaceae bacterium]
MRFLLLSLPLLIAAAFLTGYAANPAVAPAASSARVYTAAVGDVVRVPAAATRCEVGQEAGAVNLVCAHTTRARFSVVFFKDNLLVYRNGNPDNPAFSARGNP